jgi:hypothetical protein
LAGKFNYSGIFKKSFETRCLRLLVDSYHSAIADKSISPDWNENDITSTLNSYISKNEIRLQWEIVNSREEYLFDKDSQKTKGFADREFRIDMKLTSINSGKEYVYYFEAKNLKENDTALKRRYIDTGMDSFTNGKYKNGALVGYFLNGNLFDTVVGINKLLAKDSRDSEILIQKGNQYHDSYFESTHASIGLLKHLFFDFTLQ